jgi:hypothetical protein
MIAPQIFAKLLNGMSPDSHWFIIFGVSIKLLNISLYNYMNVPDQKLSIHVINDEFNTGLWQTNNHDIRCMQGVKTKKD